MIGCLSHRGLRVMMVTACGDDERRCRARKLGAFEFIFDQLKDQLPAASCCFAFCGPDLGPLRPDRREPSAEHKHGHRHL